jgi:hypothetical protein
MWVVKQSLNDAINAASKSENPVGAATTWFKVEKMERFQ